MSRKALGRGLEALIPKAGTPAPENKNPIDARVERGLVAVDRIRPNPWQPRRNSDPIKMDELVRSIQTHGILEPLLLRKYDDSYELVAGERRLRAAQRAGIKEVPAIIVDLDDQGSLEIALIENIQREELSAVDEARAYQVLAQEFGRTHDEIANQVGKDRSTVTNLLRLLKLPPDILALLAGGRLSMGHARALLSVASPMDQAHWAQWIVDRGWSVREAERRIALSSASKEEDEARKQGPAKDPHIMRVEESIRQHVGTEVRLHHGRRGGGRLEFLYTDQEELERILDLLGVQVH
jgi:ParB family transcriptional regulator, chromosome partitioning protein